MPMDRLTVLFDRKPRHSKSTSNLSDVADSQGLAVPSQRWKRSKSRGRLSIMFEHRVGPVPPQPKHAPPPPPTAGAVSPMRASTTPTMHPPDELFLRMVRRRSANARLEEQRIQNELDSIEKCSNWPDTIPTPVAVAHALPPQYFELPPEYESPQRMRASPPIQTRATIARLRDSELFLEDPLKAQIDQTIADFRGFRLTEATPLPTPTVDEALVSPINDIDTIYLERRREKRRPQRLNLIA